ncbi:DNA-directed RNA polymerase subunit epsilon [Limosilactobacillus pontis]|uniref:DNA-directed RNA polymerase subunit epsilon n=1 Tax=Limosilactobacillus pontis TaxID=35787 RepID=UPI00241C70D2|nr:DNA-directed RNA polymerase subunit epsilon [Limosilactobacillus pontis]
MTFKVYYQSDKTKRPVRENTQSMYIEADSEAEALLMVEHNTDYNIEYVEQLDDQALAYEKQNPNFKITTFD